MRVAFLIAAVAVIAAPAALAEKHPKKPIDPNKKMCRLETTTGSITGVKSTCHTYAEWKAIDAANAEQLRNTRESSGTGAGVRTPN